MKRRKDSPTKTRSRSRSTSISPSKRSRHDDSSALSSITHSPTRSISSSRFYATSLHTRQTVLSRTKDSRSPAAATRQRRRSLQSSSSSSCGDSLQPLVSFAANPGQSVYNIGHAAMVLSKYASYRLFASSAAPVSGDPHEVDVTKANNHFLAIGLGNVGLQYVNTRHNVGRDCIYTLGVKHNAPLLHKSHLCEYSDPITLPDVFQWNLPEITHKVRQHNHALGLPSTTPIPVKPVKLTLAVPDTFMNLSGKPVRDLMQYLNIPHYNVIVFHDDLEVKLGHIRVRDFGTHGGQRGVQDVLKHLGFNSPFIRVRIGVGRPTDGKDVSDYVLERFPPSEIRYTRYPRVKGLDLISNIIKYGPVKSSQIVQKANTTYLQEQGIGNRFFSSPMQKKHEKKPPQEEKKDEINEDGQPKRRWSKIPQM